MFDNELKDEADSKKALDKYGPSGLAGGLNQNNLQISNGIFKMPHTFNGFGVKGYKDGGIVKGPGTGTSDSIPAKLPVASAIIPAHIVKLYGKDYFDKLEAAAPKSDETKGKVDAKISNGEYQLSPDAVKYWGQDFITKLIGSDNEASETNDSPNEEAAEMQHYADGGIVDTGFSAVDKALGKNPPPLFTQNPNPPLLGLKNGMPDYGYGNRWDEAAQSYSGPPKGVGYYGEVRRPDGNISGELGIGTKQGEIPSMVPGMTPQEMQTAITGGKYTDAMYDKADSHAAWRKLNGQSPWAGINDKQELLPTNRETIVSNALAHPNDPKSNVVGYRDGGIVDQPPSLRDRALDTADSNAEFRQRNPDFGAKFAQDNTPAPSLSERVQTNTTPAQPAQTGLRGRLGMPESTVDPKPPQLGIRERLMTDANSVPTDQVAQSGLRGRLGMADNTPEPVQPQPSLRDRVFNPDAPGSTVRPNFGKNLPDSSVQMPKANPWEAEMQSTAGQGLGAKIGSGLNKFAGAAGAAGSLAGIAALAAEPSEGDNYLAAKAARGDKQAQQALATGGFNPIADRMKAPINAGLAAAGNAINDNVVQPVVGGVKRLLGGNQAQPATEATTGSFGAKSNATPQPAPAAQPQANNQPTGQPQPTPTPNAQPAPNPALAPKNQYDSALIPDGNRLQLTPEYNAYLNSKDTRTVAQRDASNATPEQIAPSGFGAKAGNAGDDYLAQRGKILAQNMEYNNQLAAMQANLAANGQPITHPAFTDTTVDPERNFGAKQRLAYDELAQNDRHANQTNALGRDELNQRKELAILGGKQTKYQAVRNPDDNTVRIVPESGPEAEAYAKRQQQDDERTQNALLWYTDPNASEAHINAAKAWLASKNIALPKI